jgi:glucosyl-dolichyl phosphate glucuronosyltransferase
MTQNKIKLSIVISTKDRSQILTRCLDSLVDQTKNMKDVEVIIINNNSSDGTVKLTHRYIGKFTNWRLVTETQLGLSYARNRGWKESRGIYVAYIDDDAIAKNDWVSQIITFINSSPEIGIFGGPYTSYTISPKASWLPKEYGTHSLGNKTREVHIGKEWINGTNMVFKKKLLKKFGGFDTGLGMKGKKISYGEEANLLLRMYLAGVPVYYCPKIKVKHLIPDYKNNLIWQLKNQFAIGYSWYPTHIKKANFPVSIYTLLRSIKNTFSYLVDSTRIPLKRRVYLSLSGLIQEIGVFTWHLSSVFNKSTPENEK